jgi:hypothetical protein
MSAVEDVFDQRYQAFYSRRPKPPYTGKSVGASLDLVLPAAKKVASLPVGHTFRHVISPAASVEHTISREDSDAAKFVVANIERIKQFGENTLPASLATDAARAYARLSVVASYLEGVPLPTLVASDIERRVQAVSEAVREAPQTIATTATSVAKSVLSAVPWWLWLVGAGLLLWRYGGRRDVH